MVNLVIRKLKSKQLVCLSFWDISRDPGFRILIFCAENVAQKDPTYFTVKNFDIIPPQNQEIYLTIFVFISAGFLAINNIWLDPMCK